MFIVLHLKLVRVNYVWMYNTGLHFLIFGSGSYPATEKSTVNREDLEHWIVNNDLDITFLASYLWIIFHIHDKPHILILQLNIRLKRSSIDVKLKWTCNEMLDNRIYLFTLTVIIKRRSWTNPVLNCRGTRQRRRNTSLQSPPGSARRGRGSR